MEGQDSSTGSSDSPKRSDQRALFGPMGKPVDPRRAWVYNSIFAAGLVGFLTGVAIVNGLSRLFQAMGNDGSFVWAAVFGGLAVFVAVGSILLSIGWARPRD